ncbi:TetR/AcrR family transcriptional regulator [Nocardioides currus]|uniref:HTH tetR-type domain-containing protein n=1 Tax=Nocardioides currus TaxID=2133958 RepID=A0A2R7YVE6_9ACTN|nr:TetR/AcrR family transcriptional regulator [Nocardioides currus]PUA80345.1 hypothetical protein C7S10_14540 [Nocardioides currus]
MTLDLAVCGLRATKKERTRQALSAAAVRIVAADGIDALTADRIAAEAGVSRRTLFNYFARVEDVLTASMDEAMQGALTVFAARPDDEPLRTSITAVLAGLLDHQVFEQAITLERAASGSPATRHFLREYDDRVVDMIETGLHERIGEAADPMYVAGLAGSVTAVLTRTTRLVVEQHPDLAPVDLTARLHEALATAFDLLFSGFDEAGAVSTSTLGQDN